MGDATDMRGRKRTACAAGYPTQVWKSAGGTNDCSESGNGVPEARRDAVTKLSCEARELRERWARIEI